MINILSAISALKVGCNYSRGLRDVHKGNYEMGVYGQLKLTREAVSVQVLYSITLHRKILNIASKKNYIDIWYR